MAEIKITINLSVMYPEVKLPTNDAVPQQM
jgi:hypothetical protein